jgi:hypothetical protein
MRAREERLEGWNGREQSKSARQIHRSTGETFRFGKATGYSGRHRLSGVSNLHSSMKPRFLTLLEHVAL